MSQLDTVDILQKMTKTCPVRNTAIIRMDSDNPGYIMLEWQWKVKEKHLYKSMKVSLLEIAKATIDIIQLNIDSQKNANWNGPNNPQKVHTGVTER